MSLVQGDTHRPVQVRVGHSSGEFVAVESFDQLSEQRCLAQREEGVEEYPTVFTEIDEGPLVCGAKLIEVESPGPVSTSDDVAESGRFYQVAELGIDGETADHAGSIELEVRHRPPGGHQAILGVIEGGSLPLFHVVVDECVVHVVADCLDRSHVEGAVSEDTT